MENEYSVSRRNVLKGLGIGIASLAVAPSFATTKQDSEPSTTNEPSTANGLEDPTTKYPKPPFKSQSQPWPGLAGKMEPKPDHGEKTYKGSGRLKGRKALITGGDSGMGRAAAIAYAREGADVAINYHPTEEEDAKEVIALIRKEGRKAIAMPGDLRSEDFCNTLVQKAVA